MSAPGYPTDGPKMNAPPPSYFETQGGPQQPPPMGFVGTTTVITTEPVRQVVISPSVPQAHSSQRMVCPYCHADVGTSVQYESGALTHIAALVLCLVGCWLGCCLIPYCVDGCKDTHHQCPSCGHQLGVVKRL